MHRNALLAQGLRALRLLVLLVAFLPSGAGALPLLSEVFYDASGSDDGLSFVEIYAAPGTVLDGLIVEGINGSNGAVTDSLDLVGVVGASGLFVLADDAGDGTTSVANADLIADFDNPTGCRKP